MTKFNGLITDFNKDDIVWMCLSPSVYHERSCVVKCKITFMKAEIYFYDESKPEITVRYAVEDCDTGKSYGLCFEYDLYKSEDLATEKFKDGLKRLITNRDAKTETLRAMLNRFQLTSDNAPKKKSDL